MRNINIFLLITSILIGTLACNPAKQEVITESKEVKFPERAKAMNMYEVNVRQVTPEGTLNAFKEHLPRLEKMGVDILWFMPIQPISEKNRKGPLGSYYSVKDYTAIHPDYGTLEDFKALVKDAHDRGMLVVLDWVANHSGFDHEWASKEGYHNTDSAGNIIWPKGTDWTDVADLNYDNENMRQEMIREMKWWVTETDIDGFRCDVAGEVPMDFWNAAKDSLDKVKDLFMLAEWDEPRMHEDAFHMTYGWGPHHWINETGKGHFNADSLIKYYKQDLERYPATAFRLMFTTNHDENSWNGTVFERLGDAHQALAVFAFTVQGMPLIYNGQEAGLDKRLRFFDKDTINWSEIKYEEFYGSLLKLKKDNPALHNGEFGGRPQFVETSNPDVIAYKRIKNDNAVYVIINLSKEEQNIVLDDNDLWGTFQNYFTQSEVVIPETGETNLSAYQYYVFVK